MCKHVGLKIMGAVAPNHTQIPSPWRCKVTPLCWVDLEVWHAEGLWLRFMSRDFQAFWTRHFHRPRVLPGRMGSTTFFEPIWKLNIIHFWVKFGFEQRPCCKTLYPVYWHTDRRLFCQKCRILCWLSRGFFYELSHLTWEAQCWLVNFLAGSTLWGLVCVLVSPGFPVFFCAQQVMAFDLRPSCHTVDSIPETGQIQMVYSFAHFCTDSCGINAFIVRECL